MHKAGFVTIMGKPNVGKSTLMNALVGERLSIITPKAQTTRHRVMGILSGDDFQLVFSDTPGIIKPGYALHESMMSAVSRSMEDADLTLLVTDIVEPLPDEKVLNFLSQVRTPLIVAYNKVDQSEPEAIKQKMEEIQEATKAVAVIPVSALHKFNLEALLEELKSRLPEGEAFFDKEQLTDKPERFFVSEIIREKIIMGYKDEIPYSVEVAIRHFKEDEKLIHIAAEILVIRDSQKGILIGKGGEKLKKVVTAARKSAESFLGKKVFLETKVSVMKDWRDNKDSLGRLGYEIS